MTKKFDSRAIRFAICGTDSEPDLEARKIYKVLPDKRAAQDNYVRVINKSGEDYLYPTNYYIFIEVPVAKERALLLAA